MGVLRAESLSVDKVLKDVAFSVEAGQCAAVIGATGTGKSVLVRALCGLLPSTGRVLVDGLASDVDGWPALQSRMGVLMSQPGLLDDLTLLENVAFKLRRDKIDDVTVRQRVMRVLEEFGLAGAASKFPAELSGGMRRRGALARALVHEPACLLLDDPTAGLDPITTTRVLRFILDAAKARGASILITTHDLRHVASHADAVMLIRKQAPHRLDGDVATWTREIAA